ncbi:hypothetical protein D8674_013147 [Pyrus ussuriensis x Pyrus communis]|uniref:Uncharacterized protein n=1 Tax=Pyrus ussuriensis x Pyrus communis TaxID=2448454 RepID=A0A5N5GPR0_9ROSA|nr:hypothetical protein D8674_013147 [Pyrus ussuriensis x Pyrus communis]
MEEQPKKACCAYFHEVLELYEDEKPYTPPKPYVPPIPFPGRFVKQKHDEPPIDVFEEIMPDIVFKALPLSSNSIDCFPKSVSDSPCCFTSLQVPSLESIRDDLLPYQEKNKLKLHDKSLLPIHHKKEDSEPDDEIAALNKFHSSIEIIAPATSSIIFEDMLLRKERRK